MIRLSTLRNVPVVFEDRRMGLLQSVCFDQNRKRICALIVSSGVHGKKIVQTQHVQTLAQRFIMVDRWSKYRRSDQQQMALFVRDTTGLLVGRVTDYAIEEETMNILAVEMIPGYFPQAYRRRMWIHEYTFSKGLDEICIPDILHSWPCFSKEVDTTCECPP